MVCPLQPSCTLRLHEVHNERRRLEVILWQRAFDHFATAKFSSISSCSHADGFYFLVHWINVTFFHELVPTIERELHRSFCPPLCAYNYRERAKRLLVGFTSYATTIRTIHTAHSKLLGPVSTCCNLECSAALSVCPDFSMQIFAAVNKLFFENLVRARKTTVSPHLVRQVQDGKFVNIQMYKAWYAKRVGFLKTLPPAMINGTMFEQPTFPYAPEEEVEVEFLE